MLPLLLAPIVVATSATPVPKPIDIGSWVGASDYPPTAQHYGAEGVVGYRLDVDPEGKVIGCRIVTSSGQPTLDQPTCDLLLQRARFAPATDASGKAVAASYTNRIRWRLPSAPAALPVVSGFASSSEHVFAKTPDPIQDPAASGPPADPRVISGQLPNGLRYAILANNTPRDAISFRLRVGVGSVDETASQSGYAHLIEHMMFRGSTNVPDGEFERSLEQMGLAMGSDTTAFTYPETTVYGLDFPPSRQSVTTTGLFLLREVVDRAAILSGPLAAEQGVVLSEKRVRDTAATRTENARLEFLLPDQPVSRPIAGTSSTINGATAAGLQAFYHTHYRPERSVLIVVGNVAPAEIEADIKARFSDWKAAMPAVTSPASHVQSRGPEVRIFIDPGAAKYARLHWQRPYDTRPDDYVRQADYLADTLTFEILNDRLLRAAAAPDAPFMAASAGAETLFHAGVDTSIGVRPVDGKLAAAAAAMITEQKRLVRYGVSQAEYDRAIAQIRARLAEEAASADTRGSPDLANALLQSFDSDSLFVTPRQEQSDVERLLRTMDVSAIDRAAARLFSGSGPLLFVSDTAQPAGGASALKASMTAALAAPVSPPPATTGIAWPYHDFGPSGRIIERKQISDLDVTVVRFANGTTATIRQTPGTSQIVVNMAFGVGMSGLPADRDHALWLLTQSPQTFIQGGLGKADLADINDALFGKNVGASLVTSQDRFYLTGRTRPEDLEAEAQLLTAYLMDPAYRPRALRDAISAQNSIRTQLAASVPLTAGQRASFLLHDRDPRWRGTPGAADLQATQNSDLAALLGPSLAGPINMVIVGDMDVERAIKVAQDTVGALPPRGPRPKVRDFHFPDASMPTISESVPGAPQQGMVLAAWPTPSFTAGMQDARSIQVLSQVVQARLMAGLRERDGLTYAPDAFVDQAVSQKRYALVGVQVELPPGKADIFFTELTAIVKDLATRPISTEELDRARAPMVDGSRRGFGFADYWADALAGSDNDPAYFEMIRSKVPDLAKVTPADVQRMARLYLAARPPFRFVVQSSAAATISAAAAHGVHRN